MAIELEARRIKQRRDYTMPVRLNQHHPKVVVEESKKVLKQAIEMISQETNKKPKMILKTTTRRSHRLAHWHLLAICSHLLIGGHLLLGRCDTSTSSSSTSAPRVKLSQKPNKSSGPSKESLLSSLAQTIELQHFKTSAKQPARLSKFDASAQDNSYLELAALHQPAIASSKNKASRVSASHGESDGMSQILRMHESANLKPAANNNMQQQQATSSVQERLKRWRSVSPPLRSMATSLIKPTKMVSQVLSYITPLVGNKLTTLKLHPFAGRSLGSFAHDEDSFVINPSSSSTTKSSRTRSTKSYTSEPTTLIDNHKAALTRKHSTSTSYSLGLDEDIKDLMADSSSLSNLISNSPLSSIMLSSDSSSSSDSYGHQDQDQKQATETSKIPVDSSLDEFSKIATTSKVNGNKTGSNNSGGKPSRASSWLRQSANHVAQNYFQNSFRDLITLSQLPILSASTISTAPSVLEKKQSQTEGIGTIGNGSDKNKTKIKKKKSPTDEFGRRALEEIYRYAYILATGVRNKKDPLSALASKPGSLTTALANYHNKGLSSGTTTTTKALSQRSINQLVVANQTQLLNLVRKLRSLLAGGPLSRARPRGVMWDMATDPSLAVTVFHLLERASVALPLGFMLMPVIRMMRSPQLNGLNFGRLLPARASHRSVDYEELAKRLDVVDKILSRALRQTHREGFMGK